MINPKTICIVGGGGQCHAIAPWLSNKGYNVNILTNRPKLWHKEFSYKLPDGTLHTAELGKISDEPQDVISEADVVIVTVPGFANAEELKKIKPYLKKDAFVGGAFSSNGYFFDALEILGDKPILWGFQRVPFIGKVIEYGKIGGILDYKKDFKIAVEHTSEANKQAFKNWVQEAFGQPTTLLNSYLEVSISNSNPLLHPARIYTWLKSWDGEILTSNPLFYEEWTDEASELYIKLDEDLHDLINVLPMSNDALPFILDYYESVDAQSLTRKLRSIKSFKGIRMPVKEVNNGWMPDLTSRYFLEDFNCGLSRYKKLADANQVVCPTIDLVYQWGQDFLTKYSDITEKKS